MKRQETGVESTTQAKKLKVSHITPSATLTNLPNDILANIFVYLDPMLDVLPNVMPVCETFYKALGGREVLDSKLPLYERIILKPRYASKRMNCSKSYLQRIVNYISRTSTTCKVLKLGERAWDQSAELGLEFDLSIEFFEQSIKTGCFNGLKKLHIYFTPFFQNLRPKDVNILQKWFANLTCLETLMVRNALPQPVMNTIVNECKNLKHLVCPENNLHGLGVVLKGLESLKILETEFKEKFNEGDEYEGGDGEERDEREDVGDDGEEKDQGLSYDFFSKVPNLKKLHFHQNFEEFEDDCLTQLTELHCRARYPDQLNAVNRMTKLERINISEIEWDEHGLLQFISQFRLKKFPCSYADTFFEQGLTACVDLLALTLEHIRFSFCTTMDNSQMLQFLTKFKEAITLELVCNSDDNKGIVKELFSEMTHLREINLTIYGDSQSDILGKLLNFINGEDITLRPDLSIVPIGNTFLLNIQTQKRGGLKLRVKVKNFFFDEDEGHQAVFKVYLFQ